MDDPAKRLENYTEMFLNGKLSEEEFQILKNAIMAESSAGKEGKMKDDRLKDGNSPSNTRGSVNQTAQDNSPQNYSPRTLHQSNRLNAAQLRKENNDTTRDNIPSNVASPDSPMTPFPQSERPDFTGFSELPLEELIGVGELARVFRMKDISGTEVAVKLIRKEYQKPNIIDKIFPILQQILQVQSEILVSYLDFIVEPEPYIMMEYLDGAPFSVNDEPVPHVAVDFIFQKLLEGLTALHNQGIMHGDLKPSNVFLCRDSRCKILDPLMWTILNSSEALQGQNWIGEITHMGPERFDGIQTFASDIYAMGLLVWELLTGQKACPSGTLPNGERVDWYMQEMWHREELLPDPRLFQSDIPEWLIVCIQRFTNKDPRKRPQSANDALQLWLQGSSGRLISQEDDSYHQSGHQGTPSNRQLPLDGTATPSSHSAFQPNEFQDQSSSEQGNLREEIETPTIPLSGKHKRQRKERKYSDNEEILFRQHPRFDRVLTLLAQRAKRHFTQDLKLKSINTESVAQGLAPISANKYSTDTQIISMPIYKVQTRHRPKKSKKKLGENEFSIDDIIGHILIPLDFISKLISWSTGGVDDQDESLQLSWIMQNFALQFMEKLFSATHSHLKFTTFIGEPTLELPTDKGVFSYGYVRIIGHTKISIFMSNHLFSPNITSELEHAIPSLQPEEYLIEDIPLQLRVRTDKIRIPLHKFQNLQVGAMFPLPKNWLSEVIVSINSKDVFLGTYGESGEEKAVQLTKYISDQKKIFP